MKTKLACAAAIFSTTVLPISADTTNYQSPVDGMTYRADWHLYTPTNSPNTNTTTNRIQKQEIRLLATQEAFTKSVDVSELANYIKATEDQIDRALGKTNEAFALAVKTTLSKDKKPDFKIASNPAHVSQELLKKIYEALDRMPDFRSRSEEVSYEIRFNIAKRP